MIKLILILNNSIYLWLKINQSTVYHSSKLSTLCLWVWIICPMITLLLLRLWELTGWITRIPTFCCASCYKFLLGLRWGVALGRGTGVIFIIVWRGRGAEVTLGIIIARVGTFIIITGCHSSLGMYFLVTPLPKWSTWQLLIPSIRIISKNVGIVGWLSIPLKIWFELLMLVD